MDTSKVRIIEAYRDYRPPFDVSHVVNTLMGAVPEKYQVGLGSVVLVSSDGLSRKDRLGKLWSRKRKVAKSEALGLYYRKWQGKLPWIEIRVDKVIAGIRPRVACWLPAVRNISFAHVFYHELGHHIHRYIRPEYKEREDVADIWSAKLMGNFLRKRYWYAVWPFVLRARFRKWKAARAAESR